MPFFIQELVTLMTGSSAQNNFEGETPDNTAFKRKRGAFGMSNPFDSKPKNRPCPNYNPCLIQSRMTEYLANLHRVPPTHRIIDRPCPPAVQKPCRRGMQWPPSRDFWADRYQ